MTAGRHARPRSRPFAALVAILVLGAVGAVAYPALRPDTRPTRAGSPQPTAPATTAAPTSPSPADERGSLLIHGAGDVSLDPGYISTYAARGYGYAWSGLGGLFRRDDLTVVNVECPVSDLGAQLDKRFSFHGSADALPAMRKAGVEVGSLANNHAYDRGPEALVDSVKNLRRAGIAPVGAGANEAEALAPATFELNGWTVAVLGFDEVIDPEYQVAGPDSPGTAAGHDFSKMVTATRAAAATADLVVVMVHWGVELDTQPRDEQVREGHRLIEAGADVIFGSHAHRLQPMETYRGRPIFYGLGNFVWPNFSSAGSTTAVAEVRVTPGGKVRGRLLPASIVADGHPVLR